ncbi:MAG TPA: hypothetical protein DCQ31_11105 [Bacteroidales bacterium]|nr:hypothetical protein [Bacteroidales bacterium]
MKLGKLLVIAMVLVFAVIGCTNREEMLMGSWRMIDYNSTEPISPELQRDYQTNIENLKRTFALELYDDFTFERKGFGAVERGAWFLQDDGESLVFITQNTDQQGTVIIKEITKRELTIQAVQGDTIVTMLLEKFDL